ncbi:GH1 family beta-glucosidase [Parasphingorhabdus sp.]|uniref:GH1 family beta-glucosidase n=1 Tax=Parasphingorhabdus sp. TaxID=2709688 RepID=UPI0032644549
MSNKVDPSRFTKDFVWGAATAAYQIEGAVDKDGKGPSIWDSFTTNPDNIADGTDGIIACGHYDRLEQDLDLIAELGLTAYRFSIAWSRIFPDGKGAVNQAGLDFYGRLIDGLLARGVRPFPTLFHWDMPQALYDENGGFMARDTAYYFADYAETVVRALGDRVKSWITLNEPWEHTFMGHLEGVHAPGVTRFDMYMPLMHHQLLGHGLALERIRAATPDAEAGVTLSLTPMHPDTDSDKDRAAARRLNEFLNFVTLDPLFKSQYPGELTERFAPFPADIRDGDMDIISAKVDFVGINTYQRAFAKHDDATPLLQASEARGEEPRQTEFYKDGTLHSTMGWEVYPDSLGEVLGWIRNDYGNPTVYMTENGIALDDHVVDGRVEDPLRAQYLEDHIAQIQSAQASGSDIRGYFVWTLMDNFEWAAGCEKRFGLIHTNYDDLTRMIKASGYWYRDFIAAVQKGS